MQHQSPKFRSTTVLLVRKDAQVALAGDGQVTMGETVMKASAKKVRRLYNDRILAGFAGATGDAFSLLTRFESKLEQYHGNLERAATEKKGIPIFAICFGMQILNVYRGGTLIQDIESQVLDAIKHEQGSPRDRRSHSVKLLPGSVLEKLAGAEQQAVNSHHHQAIEVIGRDLVATAWSTDGLVEAFEDPRAEPFVMAVQWHPELGWENDEFSQAIFRHFVTQARDNKQGQRDQLAKPDEVASSQ